MNLKKIKNCKGFGAGSHLESARRAYEELVQELWDALQDERKKNAELEQRIKDMAQ